MSNRIDTSHVVSPLREQPVTIHSLNFIQDNVEALAQQLALSLYPNNEPFSPKALYGCENLGGNIQTGVFFGGAFLTGIYVLNGPVNTAGWTNPPLLVPTTTQSPTADPLTFSDGSVFNVHNIKRYNVVDQPQLGATAGSFLYSTLGFINTQAYGVSSPGWSGTVFAIKQGNIVHLKGTISCTIPGSSGFTFSALPAALRPASTKVIPTTVYDDGTEYASHINVSTGGVFTNNMSWVSATSLTKFYFDGLSYYVGSGW